MATMCMGEEEEEEEGEHEEDLTPILRIVLNRSMVAIFMIQLIEEGGRAAATRLKKAENRWN